MKPKETLTKIKKYPKRFISKRAVRFSYLIGKPLTKPNVICLIITEKCNYKCLHCDIWKTKKTKKELTFNQWKDVITKLHDWLGPFNVSVSGGEPLLKNYTLPIIKLLKRKNCYVKLNTNGELLSKETSKKLISYCVDEIIISFYSVVEPEYNQIRNVKNKLLTN